MQQLRSASSAAAAADEVLAALPALMRFLRSQMRHRRGQGLTVPQFRALIFVNRHPEATLSALAEHIGLSTAAASRMVTTLVRHRLLTRTVHPRDRRAVMLRLTGRGQGRFDAAWSGMQHELTARLSVLGAAELHGVSQSLHCLKELFGDDAPVAAPRRAPAGRRKTLSPTKGPQP